MNLPKPKRGHKFYWPEKNITVYLERIISPTSYFIYEDERRIGNSHYVNPGALKSVKEPNKPISSKPKKQNSSEKQFKDDLNAFYDKVGLRTPFNCECCGKPLYAFTKKAKRSVAAHILPKAYFESVATNEDNILFMGADYIGCPCNCHDRYDMNSEIRSKMAVYPLALERFDKLKPHLTDKELISAYTYLGLTWG